jgi:hypothetical protein
MTMSDDQNQFLSLLGQLPARLTVEQAAWVLNCQPHDLPVLIAARLVKPLGNPVSNGIKFFATSEILESAKDRHWLMKVTGTINQHWQKKNQRKKRFHLAVVVAVSHMTQSDNSDANVASDGCRQPGRERTGMVSQLGRLFGR